MPGVRIPHRPLLRRNNLGRTTNSLGGSGAEFLCRVSPEVSPMPRRYPQPFWHSQVSAWYVQIGKKQIRLSPDKDEAFRLYHAIMQQPENKIELATLGSSALVVEILDAFLDWTKKNQTPRTYDWHRDNIQKFAKAIPVGLTVEALKPFHVTEVMDAHPEWKANTKNGFARSIQRAFRWAHKQGHLERNPIPFVEKPGRERREDYITPEEFERILSWYPDGPFRDVLITAWETGCRPQELFKVEARHVDMANKRWVFKVRESKGKIVSRIVYLSDKAFEITDRLAKEHPK